MQCSRWKRVLEWWDHLAGRQHLCPARASPDGSRIVVDVAEPHPFPILYSGS
jgi:hypothetical protein